MDELALQKLWADEQHEALTAAILREIGPELLGFIRSRLRDTSAADDAYADFSLDLWRSLPGFRGHCSFQAWAYTLARNAALRMASRRLGPRDREVGLSQLGPELEALVRSTRPRYLRSETRDAFAALREQLSEDEQTMLVLRVDKELDWRDVAAVLLGDAGEPELVREAARLRQQFKALKVKLARMARAAGLFDPEEP